MQKPQSVSDATHEGPGTRPQTYRYVLKYRGVAVAVSVLGSAADIRDTSISFQKYLYARQAAM